MRELIYAPSPTIAADRVQRWGARRQLSLLGFLAVSDCWQSRRADGRSRLAKAKPLPKTTARGPLANGLNLDLFHSVVNITCIILSSNRSNRILLVCHWNSWRDPNHWA